MKIYNEIEFNQQCAKLLGWKQNSKKSTFYIERDSATYIYKIQDLRFHSDYNWIMDVVESIQSLGYKFEIKLDYSHFSNSKHTQVVLSKTEGEFTKDRTSMFNLNTVYKYISPTYDSQLEALIITIWHFFQNKSK
jgi:hypothetical protein